jgi:hypothetical protein
MKFSSLKTPTGLPFAERYSEEKQIKVNHLPDM